MPPSRDSSDGANAPLGIAPLTLPGESSPNSLSSSRLSDGDSPGFADFQTKDNPVVEAVSAVLLWRRPIASLLILACATLVYYHFQHRNATLLSLCADVLLIFAGALGIAGFVAKRVGVNLPIDPLEWQLSDDAAKCFAAALANTVGATEGLLRVAASGRDCRLFFKVVSFLFLIAALGRGLSGPTVVYLGIWCMFVLPGLCSMLTPEATAASGPALRGARERPSFQ